MVTLFTLTFQDQLDSFEEDEDEYSLSLLRHFLELNFFSGEEQR